MKLQKPYKNIHKTDKTDPETTMAASETTMAAAASEAAIVVSGSVLSVLSMFLYGFCIFTCSQDQSYQFYQCFCMVFAFSVALSINFIGFIIVFVGSLFHR